MKHAIRVVLIILITDILAKKANKLVERDASVPIVIQMVASFV